jgi:hypothetical protein
MSEAIQVVREGACTGTLFGIVTQILGILCIARSRRREACLRRLVDDRARHARRSYRERKRASVYLRLSGEVIP